MFITSKNKYLSNDMKIFGTCSIPLRRTIMKTPKVHDKVLFPPPKKKSPSKLTNDDTNGLI